VHTVFVAKRGGGGGDTRDIWDNSWYYLYYSKCHHSWYYLYYSKCHHMGSSGSKTVWGMLLPITNKQLFYCGILRYSMVSRTLRWISCPPETFSIILHSYSQSTLVQKSNRTQELMIFELNSSLPDSTVKWTFIQRRYQSCWHRKIDFNNDTTEQVVFSTLSYVLNKCFKECLNTDTLNRSASLDPLLVRSRPNLRSSKS